MTPAEQIARCDQEIERLKQEARAGNPDVEGIMLGLHDWRTEKQLIYRKLALAQSDKTYHDG